MVMLTPYKDYTQMLVTDVLLSINETLSGEPVFTEISMFLI